MPFHLVLTPDERIVVGAKTARQTHGPASLGTNLAARCSERKLPRSLSFHLVLTRRLERGMAMRPKKHNIYRCTTCDEPHETAREAGLCCTPEPEEGWLCGECEEWYEDKDEAKECCRD